jgi:xanthine dehydrogenase accessory factor
MRDILTDLDTWRAVAERPSIALATVVQTWGSSPRRAGAKMALTPNGKITGSVSGGCVEGAVYETGVDVLKSNRPQLLHFGVADETAWEGDWLAAEASTSSSSRWMKSSFAPCARSWLRKRLPSW